MFLCLSYKPDTFIQYISSHHFQLCYISWQEGWQQRTDIIHCNWLFLPFKQAVPLSRWVHFKALCEFHCMYGPRYHLWQKIVWLEMQINISTGLINTWSQKVSFLHCQRCPYTSFGLQFEFEFLKDRYLDFFKLFFGFWLLFADRKESRGKHIAKGHRLDTRPLHFRHLHNHVCLKLLVRC